MDLSNIKKDDCCLHSDFPEVEKNIEKNEKVANKLIEIYAGSKGEFTAVCQYIYQSFIVKPEYKELSEILEKISICEMEHQEIISQILVSMGINPKFCKYIDSNQNICNYWSAGNVKYITDISQFLDYNIKLEQYAINEYNELLQLTNNQNIIDIVNEILKDENAHISIFTSIKNNLNTNYISRNDVEKIESTNNNREIVSIFSSSNDNKVDINKKFTPSNDTPVKEENISSNNSIQIPITDLNVFNDIDDG